VTQEMEKLISVSRGQTPADLILNNARVVNVFNNEIQTGNVAIVDGHIAGIGEYKKAKQTIDLKSRYLIPGFIDGHVHIESSVLDIGEYARAVVPRGTTSLVTDLHEIANVCGLEGILDILDRSKRLPLDIFLMAPSCVPATHMETPGAEIGLWEIKYLLRLKQCLGLGEVMNYPGVISGDRAVLAKIAASRNKIIDGHAPALQGNDLNAYISVGIGSDHESVALDEAREKLRRGMHIMIREGSSEKNLETLLPLVNSETNRRFMFVVDDRTCVDILNDGDIDAVVRKAIRLGLNPVRAIQMATINTAEYFRLDKLGAVAPGYRANLIVTPDLNKLPIDMVFYQGRLVAENRQPLFTVGKSAKQTLKNTVEIRSFGIESLKLKARGETTPVIGIVPGQIITKKLQLKVKTQNGYIVPDTQTDVLKAVVVERHKNTGNIGVGLIKGFGLKKGAIASSIAHDSHNIVAVGTSDSEIIAAVKQVEKMQGGLVVVDNRKVIASLPLPLAGLLSDQPLEVVVHTLEKVEKAAASLGTRLISPFSTLSFIALPVIPELRLTDMGLVDVGQFKLIT
jgi:adenine deaminase